MKLIPARIKVYVTDKKGNLKKMLFDKIATDKNIFKAMRIYYKKSRKSGTGQTTKRGKGLE